MNDYKSLKVWQASHELTLNLYKVTRHYPEEEKFGLISQIRRASSSIPTNIAEGYGQLSTTNYIRFLGIARGSSVEVDYLVRLSYDLGYLKEGNYSKLNSENITVKKMINGLIKALKSKDSDYKTT